MKTHFPESRFPKTCNTVLLLTLGLLTCAAPSFATTVSLDFSCSNPDSASSCAAGEKQKRAKLDWTASDRASFNFINVGDNASLTKQFKFDDSKELLRHFAARSFSNHGRMNFMDNATHTYPENGFGNNHEALHEILSVNFRHSFADYAVLHSALSSHKWRKSKHANVFDDGCCESSISQLPSAVPVPAAVWLFASGLFGLAGIARRRKQISPDP